jgi:hypothetical protein
MIFLDLSCSQRNKTASRVRKAYESAIYSAPASKAPFTLWDRSGIEQLLFEVDRHPTRVTGRPRRVPKPPLQLELDFIPPTPEIPNINNREKFH